MKCYLRALSFCLLLTVFFQPILRDLLRRYIPIGQQENQLNNTATKPETAGLEPSSFVNVTMPSFSRTMPRIESAAATTVSTVKSDTITTLEPPTTTMNDTSSPPASPTMQPTNSATKRVETATTKNTILNTTRPSASQTPAALPPTKKTSSNGQTDSSSRKPALLSHQWIESCVSNRSKQPLIPFPTKSEMYTLGDCLRFCIRCFNGWKGSIGDIYSNLACKNTKKVQHPRLADRQTIPEDIFMSILVNEIFPRFHNREGFVEPSPSDIVIHLRLGDAVERTHGVSVAKMLINGADAGAYNQLYPKAIKSVYEYLENIEEAQHLGNETSSNNNSSIANVVLVGGSHMTRHYKKSRVYSYCLAEALRQAGHKVQLAVDGGDADQDFYFMAHASNFVVSAGGYSRILGNMVKFLGGKVIGREFLMVELRPGIEQKKVTVTKAIPGIVH